MGPWQANSFLSEAQLDADVATFTRKGGIALELGQYVSNAIVVVSSNSLQTARTCQEPCYLRQYQSLGHAHSLLQENKFRVYVEL